MAEVVRIEGGAALGEALHAGPAEVLEASLTQVVRLLEGRAKELVPVRRGKLQKSIQGVVTRQGTQGEVRAGGRGAKHAHLIEFGTQAHPVTAGAARKRGRTRKALKLPGGIFRHSAMVGGTPKHSYLWAAVDAEKGRVDEILENTGNDYVMKVATGRSRRKRAAK